MTKTEYIIWRAETLTPHNDGDIIKRKGGERMKALIYKVSDYEPENRIIVIKTLNDLKRLQEEYGDQLILDFDLDKDMNNTWRKLYNLNEPIDVFIEIYDDHIE